MRILVILLSIIVYAFSVNINVIPDKKIAIDNGDIFAMQQYLQRTLNFHITEQGAKNLVRENRILTNKYIESPYFKKDKKYNQIAIEKLFADNYIQHLQDSIKLPAKVLKSYYLDHIDQYKKPDKVYLELFRFTDYKQALEFYQNPSHKSVKAHSKIIGWVSIDKLNDVLKSVIKKNKENYFLPPIVTKNGVNVFWVKKYKQESGYESFDKVKRQIKEYLFKKTFSKKREEILKSISKNE